MKKILFILNILLMFLICSCTSKHIHSYKEYIIEPTCEEEGYTEYICSCNDKYMDNYKDKKDHKYENGTITKEPTEEEEGIIEYKCINCEKTKEESLPKLEHKHVYKEYIIEPTCEEEGYSEYICACNDKYIDNYKDKKDHKYDEGTITKEPTEDEEGIVEYKCINCEKTKEESLPKLKKYEVYFNLNGGVFQGGYQTLDELSNEFLNDYNNTSNTNATISNFHNDSKDSVKIALSNKEFLKRWNWLFQYMYKDLVDYNTENGTMNIAYVSDTLTLLQKMINLDTTVINDATKGPNFRTLVRSYLHGMMNKSKGSGEFNTTFSKYSPNFNDILNQENIISSQYSKEYYIYESENLPIPFKEEHIFKGWYDDNKNYIEKVTSNIKLNALWEEKNMIENLEIINKIEKLNLGETHKLIWEITPLNATNKNVVFKSSNESVATVDKNGVISTHMTGTVTISIESLSSTKNVDTITICVTKPGYFDFNYETNSYVNVNDTIKINSTYYSSYGEQLPLIWESSNENIAIVDNEGNVTGLNKGSVTIKAIVESDNNIFQEFLILVVDEELDEAVKLILDAHESNVCTEYNLPIGAGTPVYYKDIIGSISKILFNDDLVINNKYNQATNDKYGEELQNRILEGYDLITVHYTGSMGKGDTAEAIAKYFSEPLSSVKTSIHYTTGNDGVFRGMDEKYRAAHAGDDGSIDTVEKFEYRETNLEVLPNDPLFPVVSITKNATFAINNRDTGIKVPKETKFGRGYVTDNKWLNKMGLAVNIKDGKYQLGTAWWCYTQVWEGRICSNGGNRNSIGIEACVNEGSDLWYTWQKTAQLVADIMYRHNIDITKVKGHHFFSAKVCPQPFLERDLVLWWEFIDLVQAEYQKILLGDKYQYIFTSNSSLIDNKGRVIKQELYSKVIVYKVEIITNEGVETIELSTILEGSSKK